MKHMTGHALMPMENAEQTLTYWFGDPWPSWEKRSPICSDDELWVVVPDGIKCIECSKRLTNERDHGVVTGCNPSIWGHFALELSDGGVLSACAYHLACYLAVVCGGVTEGTRVEERQRGARTIKPHTPMTTSEYNRIYADLGPGGESATPGGGWKK